MPIYRLVYLIKNKTPGFTRLTLLFLLVISSVKFTIAQTADAGKYKYTFTVAKDETGEFKYIQDAIDAMRVYPLAPITLYIKNGVYNEKIELPSNNTDVTFIGESADSTIIKFNDYSGRGKLTTFTSYTAKISGNRFTAIDITFVNDAGNVGQAIALYVDADKALFERCRFIGNQDTIFAAGETSRQLFRNCYIEGTTDFIFGPATTVFENCIIKAKSNSYITAASTTEGKEFGLVFLDCRIIADSNVASLYLGRPWRAYAKTVFINSILPSSIRPEGWSNWSDAENEKTAFYAEYKNSGPGATKNNRVKWSKQLTDKEARAYTLVNIFSKGANSKLPEEGNWFRPNNKRTFRWISVN